ncbi:MAG TPA: cytoplasmic protein [Pyrinomonadaceae bacterium]
MNSSNRIFAAHEHSSDHREELLKSDICGCFHCLEIYSPQEIKDWVDDSTCALCAKCGIDSVIGSASNYPVTKEFLKEMKSYWFDGTIALPDVKEHFGDL